MSLEKVNKTQIGVVIITHHARLHLTRLLPALQRCEPCPRILVVNSSSHDGTVEEALKWGVEVLIVPRHEFNHGVTRELARHKIGTPVVVMMTPDAYPEDVHCLQALTEPIFQKKAAATYARQLPHLGADVFERFARDFHYPKTSRFFSEIALQSDATESLFFSNSCSAYCQKALDHVGGFPHVLLGEDTITAGALLKAGYTLGYVAEALVRHSHRYSLTQEFMRHFDIGCMRHLLGAYGQSVRLDHKRGIKYAQGLLSYILQEAPLKLPYAALHLLSKFSGYHVGKLSPWMPYPVCRFLSSQKFYWDSLKKDAHVLIK